MVRFRSALTTGVLMIAQSQSRPLVQSRSVRAGWDRSSDEELLRASRRAPAAFGVFYERYEERVLRYFLARVGDAEVAADLTAETFAAALAGTRRFRARKGPAAAWLFGIARNTLAMSQRRGRVEARARRRIGTPLLVLTDELVERIEALGGGALELVEELPADQRDAVRARVVDEREYADIAKDLRCSEAVIRKRVSRGLARLRDQLGEA
jgi:RNA polymerase sigma factor (sigma-70 family)